MRTRGEPGDIRCDRAVRHAQQTPDPRRHGLASNSSSSTEERTEAPAGSQRCARRHTGIQDPASVKPSPQYPRLASGNYNVLESHVLPNPSLGIRFGRQPQRLKAKTLQALGRNALDPASRLRLPVCPERASCGSWSMQGDGSVATVQALPTRSSHQSRTGTAVLALLYSARRAGNSLIRAAASLRLWQMLQP